MAIGTVSLLLGSSSVYNYKASHGADHFTTWHSVRTTYLSSSSLLSIFTWTVLQTFAFITVSWLIVQASFGGLTVWANGAAFGGAHRAKLLWKYHRLSGYVLILSLFTTVHLGGGWSTWVEEHSGHPARLVAYTLAPLGILVSIYSRVRCRIYSFHTSLNCLTKKFF
jgi:cytochrome b-561 domain containing protein 2